MPTGYTAGVQDGKVTDFATFALACARAFGACIELRDAPSGTPIPDEFKPSDYHAKGLETAEAEYARLTDMSPAQIDKAAAKANLTAETEWLKSEMRRKTEKCRYEAMLIKAQAWRPPTSEHVAMKDFMIEQLKTSIDFDCSENKRPKPLSAEAWHSQALGSARWSVNYHKDENRKEIERAAGRTAWVHALRKSLK